MRTPTTSSTPLASTPARRTGITITGVDDIDLWVGGLAEEQQAFGGLLGATFNYVFEHQMEDLQDGDRFYYLSRTAGMNLLTQLEGNSFAELISRNTDVQGLPADSFSRPDLILNVANLGTTGAIPDDPTTPDINEGTDPAVQKTSSVPPAAVSATTAPSMSCSTAGTPARTTRSSRARVTTPCVATVATTSSRAATASTTSSVVSATTS